MSHESNRSRYLLALTLATPASGCILPEGFDPFGSTSDGADETDPPGGTGIATTIGDTIPPEESSSGDESSGDSTSSEGQDSTGQPEPTGGQPATGISIVGIEANQGVAIPVVEGGQLLSVDDRVAPLVRNRHMLVRVYWELDPTFEARDIEARLHLDHGADETEVLSTAVLLETAPNPQTLDGTINFVLQPEQVTPGMQFRVTLHEVADHDGGTVIAPDFPAEGMANLGVPETSMKLAITLVPYRVGGSLEPLLGEAELAALRDNIYRVQPIEYGEEGLELRVYPEMQEAPDPDVHDNLDVVCALRASDIEAGIASDHDYYQSLLGVDFFVNPVGVAFILGPGPGPRCGVNQWPTWGGNDETFMHELGHNQGRSHAPCGVAGDPDFPHRDGSIGQYGWDPISGALLDPNIPDYMGYCGGIEVSDYNYAAYSERNADVQVIDPVGELGASTPLVLHGHERPDGTVKWSTYREQVEPGLESVGEATLTTIEGQRIDVTLYGRALPHGRAVVGAIEGVEDMHDIVEVDSSIFGPAAPAVPTLYAP